MIPKKLFGLLLMFLMIIQIAAAQETKSYCDGTISCSAYSYEDCPSEYTCYQRTECNKEINIGEFCAGLGELYGELGNVCTNPTFSNNKCAWADVNENNEFDAEDLGGMCIPKNREEHYQTISCSSIYVVDGNGCIVDDKYDVGAWSCESEQVCKTSGTSYSCSNFNTNTCENYPGCILFYEGSIKTNFIPNKDYTIVEVADENRVITRTESDKFGNLLKVIEAKGTTDEVIANYEYDILGRMIKAINPEGQSTTKEYNSIGQVISETYPDSGRTTFLYDLNGNPIKSVDALGRETVMEYDVLNRPLKILWMNYNGKNQHLTAMQYYYDNSNNCIYKTNSIGRVCKIFDLSGSIDFKYNDQGQIVEEVKTIDGEQFITKYNYNKAGLVTSIIYPSGKKIIYEYNQLLQFLGINIKQGNEEKKIVFDVNYNPTGSIESFKYGNSIKTSYDYNIREWLESIDSQVIKRSFDYDFAGNMLSMYKDVSKKVVLNNYQYDNLYRVKNVKSDLFGEQKYEYDKIGNRLKLTNTKEFENAYSYEKNNNKLQTISKTNLKVTNKVTGKATAENSELKYNIVGSLVQDSKYKYYYDYENRLIKVTTLTDAVFEEYVYDYLGNRIKKMDSDKTTIYIYDLGSNLIEVIAPPPKPTKIIYKFNKVEQRNPNNYKTCECDTKYRSINCCYG
ncbi:MAG: hypothetical protein KKF65_07740, partial [Nanoarchaeota archaeon]|nr:hypothetical protein [Nanoarchaeota archaeon]